MSFRKHSVISRKELVALSDSLEKNKMPYTYLLNNHTSKIECALGNFMATDSLIPLHELWLVAWVKNYVLKNEIHKKIKNICRDWESIRYLRVKHKPRKVFHRIYEVDLDRAYWETAFETGVISDELYWRGLWVDKKTRLAAIGQMAKRTDVWKFDGETMRVGKTNISKQTQHLWFNVCYKVGLLMERAARLCPDATLFYWVDGIYVTNKKAAKKIVRFFHSKDYPSKIRPIRKFVYTPTMIKIHEKKVRKFYVSSGKFGLMK